MELVQRHIVQRQDEWRQHAFFELLEGQQGMSFLVEVGRRLTFWPLAYQDLLGLLHGNLDLDRDDDLWFLRDLAAMGIVVPSAGELFHVDHAPARRAAYNLLAEAIMTQTEPARIALLLSLQATGHVFFTATAAFVRRMGCHELEYFSQDHRAIERQRAIFDRKAHETLRTWPPDAGAVCEALAVVDSCFDAIETMFHEILAALPAWEVHLAA